jgi:predicted metal-binding membrane protein
LDRSERVLTPLCLFAVAGLAWMYLLHLEQQISGAEKYRRAMAAMGMNSIWVAAITVFVCTEKVGPRGTTGARFGGAGLILFSTITIYQLL